MMLLLAVLSCILIISPQFSSVAAQTRLRHSYTEITICTERLEPIVPYDFGAFMDHSQSTNPIALSSSRVQIGANSSKHEASGSHGFTT